MFNRSDQLVLAHIVPGRPLVVTLLLSLVVMLVPSLVKWGDRLMVGGGGNLLVDGPGPVRPRILASLAVVLS